MSSMSGKTIVGRYRLAVIVFQNEKQRKQGKLIKFLRFQRSKLESCHLGINNVKGPPVVHVECIRFLLFHDVPLTWIIFKLTRWKHVIFKAIKLFSNIARYPSASETCDRQSMKIYPPSQIFTSAFRQ